jgi:hypothetical protein
MANLFDYAGWGSTVTIPRDPLPVFTGGPDGRTAELTFLITPISALGPFLDFVAGVDETVPIAGGGSITRRVPLRHPDDPDMYIESYSREYFGTPLTELWAPGKSIYTEQFSHARLRCFFRTRPVGVGPGLQYYSISRESGATAEVVPGNAMVTASGRALTGEGWVTLMCQGIVLTTYMSPDPISYAVDSLVGSVNSAPLVLLANTYPTGTVRFENTREEILPPVPAHTLESGLE